MCSYMTGEDRIIRHICGNTAGREPESYLTSAWGEDAKDRRSSWDSSKAFCRPTAMPYEKVGGPKLVHAGCWAHYPDSGVIQRRASDGLSSAGLTVMTS